MCTALYTSSIQRTSKDVITYTGEVFHTAAANKHDAVFLQVVTFAGDVCIDLFLICQPYTGHLTHGGVRLLGGCSVNTYTNTTSLRTSIKCARFAFLFDNLATFAN